MSSENDKVSCSKGCSAQTCGKQKCEYVIDKSYTEVVKTRDAIIQITMHSTNGNNDYEISHFPDGKQMGPCCSNEKDQWPIPLKRSTPSEIEIAKLIDEHQRETAARKKEREDKRAAKRLQCSVSSETIEETCETQLKAATAKAKTEAPNNNNQQPVEK